MQNKKSRKEINRKYNASEKGKANIKRYRSSEKGEKTIKKWNKSNPEKVIMMKRKHHLKNKYGLSLDNFRKLIEECDGKCKLCGKKMTFSAGLGNLTACVDHNHITGKVRGLLCYRCNLEIGFVEKFNNNGFIAKAVEYLNNNN